MRRQKIFRCFETFPQIKYNIKYSKQRFVEAWNRITSAISEYKYIAAIPYKIVYEDVKRQLNTTNDDYNVAYEDNEGNLDAILKKFLDDWIMLPYNENFVTRWDAGDKQFKTILSKAEGASNFTPDDASYLRQPARGSDQGFFIFQSQ